MTALLPLTAAAESVCGCHTAAMAGVFKATAQDGLARCGVLAMRSGSVMTPTPMLYTRRGGALYLTPDMLEKLRPGAQLVQANALQL